MLIKSSWDCTVARCIFVQFYCNWRNRTRDDWLRIRSQGEIVFCGNFYIVAVFEGVEILNYQTANILWSHSTIFREPEYSYFNLICFFFLNLGSIFSFVFLDCLSLDIFFFKADLFFHLGLIFCFSVFWISRPLHLLENNLYTQIVECDFQQGLEGISRLETR